MAVRPEIQYLIDFVRELIYDTDEPREYTDVQIQDHLDMNRLDLYTHKLTGAGSLSTSGTTEYKDFFSNYTFWEEDVVLQKPDGTVLTPTTAQPKLGKWQFSDAQQTDILATGRVYNVYGVCSKLLFQWETTMRNQFNFTADGITVQRINQVKDLHSLALTFRAMAWGTFGSQSKLVRKDIRG